MNPGTHYNFLYLKEHRICLKCINILSLFIWSDISENVLRANRLNESTLPLYKADRQTKASGNASLGLCVQYMSNTLVINGFAENSEIVKVDYLFLFITSKHLRRIQHKN